MFLKTKDINAIFNKMTCLQKLFIIYFEKLANAHQFLWHHGVCVSLLSLSDELTFIFENLILYYVC